MKKNIYHVLYTLLILSELSSYALAMKKEDAAPQNSHLFFDPVITFEQESSNGNVPEEGKPESLHQAQPFNHTDRQRLLSGEKKLAHAQLQGADLHSCTLEGVDLSHANLEGTIFCGAILKNVNLSHTNLTKALFIGAKIYDKSTFEGAIIDQSNFSDAIIIDTYFTSTKLYHTLLKVKRMLDTQFNQATLIDVTFAGAPLKKITFAKSDLQNINMSRINASEISFIECPKLQDITFKHAQIVGLRFYATKLIGPNISFDTTTVQKGSCIGINNTAVIKEADLSGATLQMECCNVRFDHCKNIKKLAGAFGSIFTDVSTVPPEDLARFKEIGAKLNGKWGDDIAGSLRREESFWKWLKRIAFSISERGVDKAAGALGSSLGNGKAQQQNEDEKKDQA
ncbi:MAG: pentapeptide repeat-containing protein [Candidatus Babeliales bacterium]